MRYLEGTDSPKPISSIGLGTWQFGSREWGYGSDYASRDAHLIVARALELGVTVFDTAEAYGFGRSERILGSALAEHGGLDEAFIATKVFPVFPIAPVVRQRARASASRLGVKTIDLYQVHWPNPVVRDGTIMDGMRDLQDSGVVTDVGVSNYSLDRWQGAERRLGRRVLSNQIQFSLAHPGPLDDLVPFAQTQGRIVIAWSPLAQGFLSGRYGATNKPTGNVRRMNPLFQPRNLELASDLLDTLRDVAATHDVTPSQVALAWLIDHPSVIVIPGAASVAQVEANAAAADIVLTHGEVTELTTQARRFQPISNVNAVTAGIKDRLHR